MIKVNIHDLLYLCDKLSHETEEQQQTIDELLHKIEKQNQKIGDMQKEIERLHKVFDIKDDARCELVKENKDLKIEIDLLNNQIDNLVRNIEHLCDENIRLRHELNEVKNNDSNY